MRPHDDPNNSGNVNSNSQELVRVPLLTSETPSRREGEGSQSPDSRMRDSTSDADDTITNPETLRASLLNGTGQDHQQKQITKNGTHHSQNLSDQHPTNPPRRNSANFTRRRSSTPKLPPEFLQHYTLQQSLDPENGSKLQGIMEDNQMQPEQLDLTIPTKLWPQIFAAISISLASMIIGLSTAYTSPAISSMSEENSTLRIESNGDEASWIGSLMPLGAMLGGIIGGTLVELIGRKRTILATALPFILSWLLIANASNIYMIYVARGLAGLCVGINCLSLPLYLAETVQPEVRGTLGLMPTTVGNTGILIAYGFGSFLNWSNLAFLGALLCLPYLITMLFIPETPRWYIANGRETEGEASLQWLRGAGADIKAELIQIQNANILAKKYAAKLKNLFGRAYIKPLIVSIGLMFFQQFSGINAVIFYANPIFKMTGTDIDENLCTIILAGVNIGATICATIFIDRVGRKVLLLISNSVLILTLLSLGAFFYFREMDEESVSGLGWIPLLSLILYVVSFSLGFGPIPWVIMGEIYPARIRSVAAGLTTSFNWACTFLVTKCFPYVVDTFGASSAFFGFAIICMFAVLFIVFYVPETQGDSLEDIETKLTRAFRRVSSTANLKPFPMSV